MTTLGEILGQLNDREIVYGLLLESGNAESFLISCSDA